MSDGRSYLGRGYEDIPGKPFGWAWHRERDEIRAHLRKRLDRFGSDHLARARLEARVSRIQERLHKHKPTFAERQAAWRARQPKPTGAHVLFTFDELERLAELFAAANDPVTASIGEKAAEAIRAAGR